MNFVVVIIIVDEYIFNYRCVFSLAINFERICHKCTQLVVGKHPQFIQELMYRFDIDFSLAQFGILNQLVLVFVYFLRGKCSQFVNIFTIYTVFIYRYEEEKKRR